MCLCVVCGLCVYACRCRELYAHILRCAYHQDPIQEEACTCNIGQVHNIICFALFPLFFSPQTETHAYIYEDSTWFFSSLCKYMCYKCVSLCVHMCIKGLTGTTGLVPGISCLAIIIH